MRLLCSPMNDPTLSPEAVANEVRARVDAALLLVLTSQPGHDRALEQAAYEVAHAVGLLATGAAAVIPADAITAIHHADDHLQAGHWATARTALVTARGRLARQDARFTRTAARRKRKPQ